jgi:hypothetical protein
MILLCQSLIVVQIYLGNKKYISTWTAKPNCSLSHQFSYNDRYIKLLQDPKLRYSTPTNHEVHRYPHRCRCALQHSVCCAYRYVM